MEWQSGVWQESENSDGQVPSPFDIPSSTRYAEAKAASLRVRRSKLVDGKKLT